MRRRIIEAARHRRYLKRNRMQELSSVVHYTRLIVPMALLLVLDSVLNSRLEYILPLWLCANAFIDCFELKGIKSCTALLVLIAWLDVLCYTLIPVEWLFSLASMYVWAQYIYDAEGGIVHVQSIVVFVLAVYLEFGVRLKYPVKPPFQAYLFQPLAAHAVSYAIMTSLKLEKWFKKSESKTNKHKDKSSTNEFGFLRDVFGFFTTCCESSSTDGNDFDFSGCTDAITESHTANPKQYKKQSNTTNYIAERSTYANSSHTSRAVQSVNDYNANTVEKHCGKSNKNCGVPLKSNSGYNQNNSHTNNSQKDKKNKPNKDITPTCNLQPVLSDDCYHRLLKQLSKAKLDIQLSQQVEVNLRNEINTLQREGKNMKQEIYKLHRTNDELQTKLHNLVTSRQIDKQTITNSDKKIAEEKKHRSQLEAQIATLKKAVKKEELVKNECNETCKSKQQELGLEVKRLKEEARDRDECYVSMMEEIETFQIFKDKQRDLEILITTLRQQNTKLEHSLSAETRIKLDLFSALGEIKRQLDIRDGLVHSQEEELLQLRSKVVQLEEHITEVPVDSTCDMNYPLLKVNGIDCNGAFAESLLDPNAAVYTPTNNKPRVHFGF